MGPGRRTLPERHQRPRQPPCCTRTTRTTTENTPTRLTRPQPPVKRATHANLVRNTHYRKILSGYGYTSCACAPLRNPSGVRIAARFCRGVAAPRVLEHAVVAALAGGSRAQLSERDACRSTGSTARVLGPPRPGLQRREARRAVRCTRGAATPRQDRQRIPTPFAKTRHHKRNKTVPI